jgi:hypothetical protein
LATLALSAAVVVYAVVATDRLPEVVAGVGAAGCALTALALPGRWPSLFPLGLAAVGGSYGTFLSLRGGDVDAGAPAVAAALLVAAELGFWSLEGASARYPAAATARRVGGIALGAVATALVGSLILAATSGVSGGVGLEAAGVGAAVLTLAAIAVLASRRSV